MATLHIQGTVTDDSGATFTFDTVAVNSSVSASATISPASAPVGTLRTYTYSATSSQGLPLSYAVPVSAGIVFTPVAGNTAAFTFTY